MFWILLGGAVVVDFGASDWLELLDIELLIDIENQDGIEAVFFVAFWLVDKKKSPWILGNQRRD